MIEGATLLIGLGAQKAGTTWVYRQLKRSGACHVRSIKEAHYFDAAYVPGETYHIDRRARIVQERAAALRAALQAGDGEAVQRLVADIRMRLDHLSIYGAPDGDAAYAAWLMQGWKGQPLVADISPSYGLCGADVLARMATMAARVKFLFILRDPVDRMWSSIKMYAAKLAGADRFGDLAPAARAVAVAEAFAGGDEVAPQLNRHDYAATLAAMDEALPEPTRMQVFYERMFRPEAMARLAGFLGLDRLEADYDERPNRTAALALPGGLEQALFVRLADQYRAVARAFGGPDALPARWRSRMEAYG